MPKPLSITEFKKENPYYENVPDTKLANRIYDRYYKEKTTREDFF